ncbi:MAG: carbohydrate-binding protein [Chitinivibrionales bacterium]|nr:carbohydrate-binding protein [Chitinivibrionales bacterium]MBD3395381.1 carbohydrate-binding protein [Chitinivibrionales bacterium]
MQMYIPRSLCIVLSCLLAGCGIQIKPLPSMLEKKGAATKSSLPEKLVYRFFDEDFVSGGYAYWYPDESNVFIPEESGKNGEVALQFDLVADDYSGGSVCLYNLLYDLTPYYSKGALEFWVKGARGGEIAWVALVDEENTDGKKTVVRLPLNNYGGITAGWTQVSVPLADFGKRGVFWDPKKRVELPEQFDWDKVAEFRVEIKKGDNTAFKIWVDDIFVLRDVHEAAPEGDREYWDQREETLEPPPLAEAPEVTRLHSLFVDDLPAGGFVYVYGGKTAYKVQPTASDSNAGVFAMYQDNEDYSGVTLALGAGRSIDLSTLRDTHAGIAFWAKAAPGVSKVYVGLLDDETDGKKVQTKVPLGDYGRIDTSWQYFMIPVKAFGATGKWWNEDKKAEVLGDIEWNAINELRFSVNRYENKIDEGEPAAVYVDDIAVIEDIPGYVDPDEYWAGFASDAPDVVLHDFETEKDRAWETASGEKSEISFEIVTPRDADKYGAASLAVTYKLGDWCDVMYEYPSHNAPAKQRDWSKHWALRFSFRTDKAYQAITVQINDSGDEIFVSNVGGQKGWSEILLPFKKFNKFAYYQPPGAEENGVLDLQNVRKIDFKPAGEGTAGTYTIDNVKLTNTREIEKPKVAENVAVTVTGSFDETITQAINDGIFGINAALWDGDLLKPATASYVKACNHAVLRYPGGLRADEDHWKEVLDRKDWMVDTDEFLGFCRKTGTEAMITVNFGRGTPEEAAAWVKHVNKKRKAGVRYWEVGNELYGDWHPNHCSAEEYGARAADFIKAMKAVDSTILVTVVWVLEGEWNRVVFEHTKDLADGVNVHHYPQHAGEENDFALLAAPQSLDEILPAVRRQVKEYGSKGKSYEIWLTEWNSVDFNPGPQTLSVVNGLFVMDYLGMLARHNIEQASYWDIHNDMTPEGGDYGYLSRTGAPDGDNVPRLSYWAFKLASASLRGRLAECTTDNPGVTAYLTEKDGRTSLLVINKMPRTRADITLAIPGFEGPAVMTSYGEQSAENGLVESEMKIAKGTRLSVPAHSAVSVSVE